MRPSGQLDLLAPLNIKESAKRKKSAKAKPATEPAEAMPDPATRCIREAIEPHPSISAYTASLRPIQPISAPALYLNAQSVAQRLSISVPTVWRWARERQDFPSPVHLGPGVSRWSLDDIEAYELRCRERA